MTVKDHIEAAEIVRQKRARKAAKDATYPQSTWTVGAQIKSLEDGVIGSVIEADYAAVKVQWEDGKTSHIGKRSNVAGRFERVC